MENHKEHSDYGGDNKTDNKWNRKEMKKITLNKNNRRLRTRRDNSEKIGILIIYVRT